MRFTTTMFRAEIKKWLEYEQADQEQTLQLLDALYAGAIWGSSYGGCRSFLGSQTGRVRDARPLLPLIERGTEDNQGCGCLLDTMEEIQGDRGFDISDHPATANVFELARKIPLGATPDNNPWARAAAQGIEDYYAAKGW